MPIDWKIQSERSRAAEPLILQGLEEFQKSHKTFTFELEHEERPPRHYLNAYFTSSSGMAKSEYTPGSRAIVREYSTKPDEKTMAEFGTFIGALCQELHFNIRANTPIQPGVMFYTIWPDPDH